MSIYGYLICDECKEMVWAKDEDSRCYEPGTSDFLEKHQSHKLRYEWEDFEGEEKYKRLTG